MTDTARTVMWTVSTGLGGAVLGAIAGPAIGMPGAGPFGVGFAVGAAIGFMIGQPRADHHTRDADDAASDSSRPDAS